jgi:hypothetical protein
MPVLTGLTGVEFATASKVLSHAKTVAKRSGADTSAT